MKKRLLILTAVLCLGTSMSFAGCGADKAADSTAKTDSATDSTDSADSAASTDSTDSATADAAAEETTSGESAVDNIPVSKEDVDIEECVDLMDYKGLKLSKTVTEVTDEEVNNEVTSALTEHAEEVKDGTVEDGDIANINYDGKIDGAAFDGGSGENYDLTIGSNDFIEGFETGLIGTKVGETKDLNLKFPGDYYDSTYAGKDVVFTVKVNSIKRPAKELTDEWVQKNTDFKTVAEYKEDLRKTMQEQSDQYAESTLKSEAWQQVVAGSKVKLLLQSEIDSGAESYRKQMESYAEYSGQSLDDYLKAQDMTEDQVDEQAQEYGKSMAQQTEVLTAVLKKENIKVEDKEVQDILNNYVSEDSQYKTLEELYKDYGEDYIQQSALYERATDVIVSYADITEQKAEDSTEAADSTEATDSTEAATDSAAAN